MRFALSFIILAVFWVLLGGHGVIGHHGMVSIHDGHLAFHPRFTTLLFLVSMAIASYVGGLLLFPKGVGPSVGMAGRFLAYFPWLAWQVAKSNVDLVYRTLHPDLPIAPRVVRFPCTLQTDVGQTLLANSITLTPGTVTIGIENGEYVVHAIAVAPAESLLAGDMQRRCAWVEGGAGPSGGDATDGAGP